MPDAVYWFCSGLAAGTLLYKARDLVRHPRNPMLWAVCATLACASAVFFFSAPPVIVRVNRLLGIANVSALLVYSLIIALAASAQVLVLYWREPVEQATPVVRRRALIFGALIVVMIGLFALGSVPTQRLVDFDTFYATTPWIAEFIVLYVLAHASVGVGVARMCWRWARDAGRPWLRRGLRVIVAGAVLGLCFDVTKLTAVAARWFDGNLDRLSTEVASGFASAGVLVVAVGFILPSVGTPLTRMNGWVSRYGAYRTLRPLWHALRSATPQIHPALRVGWNLELRVTRRLTEIRDGWLALRPFFDPEVTTRARELGERAGLRADELQAVTEAAQVKAAVAAKVARQQPPAPHVQDPPGAPGAHRGGTDGMSELAWLAAVARAYAHSPVVAAAVTPAERSGPHPHPVTASGQVEPG